MLTITRQVQQGRTTTTGTTVDREARVPQEQACHWNETWAQHVQELYAPHQIKLDIYVQTLEQSIRQRKRQRTLEQDQIRFYEQRVQEMLMEEQDLLQQQTEILKKETKEMDSQEALEDEEVSSVAMQIKAMLNKRSTLRQSLRAAKETYRTANEEILKWEQECMEHHP